MTWKKKYFLKIYIYFSGETKISYRNYDIEYNSAKIFRHILAPHFLDDEISTKINLAIEKLKNDISKELNIIEKNILTEEFLPTREEIEKEFYIIPKEYIISNTTQNYRDFLKQANYMDLDSADGLLVEKKIFKTTINQTDGKKLVENQGYKLLTVGLMYLVFIPWLKEQELKENKDAKETLEEMKTKNAEWLEDQIINKNTLKINNKEIKLKYLQLQDGSFDKEDINVYGYPTKIKDSGEHYYWYPRDNEAAAFRDGSSELGLILNGEPGFVYDVLGLRRAKIFQN